MKASWNGAVIADSNDTIVVDGKHYFPAEAVNPDYLVASAKTSKCLWKGVAHYHSLVVDGKTNADAAWYYPTPKPRAAQIAGRIAFWRGVEITA